MFQTVRIIIVEDEFAIALDLETRLKKWGHEVLGIANNATQALKLIHAHNPQLIILDIHLKGEQSGIDLAKIIIKDQDIPFIYLTAYGDRNTFIEASKTYPFAFLLKPFNNEELKRSIELAINQSDKKIKAPADLIHLMDRLQLPSKEPSVFFAKEGSKIRKIIIEDILYISALDNYAKVHLKHGNVIIHEAMNALQKKLIAHNIFRVHRSFLVALNAIESIEEDQIMVGNEVVPISKSYKKSLFRKLDWF